MRRLLTLLLSTALLGACDDEDEPLGPAELVSVAVLSAGIERDPMWSWDGTRIAFASNSDGDFELYSFFPPNGVDFVRTTDNEVPDTRPVYLRARGGPPGPAR